MENTLTIPCKEVVQIKSTTVSLPYYAVSKAIHITPEYYAITGKRNNMRVTVGEDVACIINCIAASSLPPDAEKISVEAFMKAYEKAQLMITDKFLESTGGITPSVHLAETVG